MASPNFHILQVLFLFISQVSVNFKFSVLNSSMIDSCCTLMGDTSRTDSGVELTSYDANRGSANNSGKVYYKNRFRFKNSSSFASFSTYFSFKISPINNSSTGDGMTFFIQVDSEYELTIGGLLGLNGTTDNPFVALEFDTYSNGKTAIDPTNYSYHVGIDLNNMTSYNTSYANFIDVTQFAWIDYDAGLQLLELRLTNQSSQDRPSIPVVSAQVDLFNFFNNSDLYVGFSASASSRGEYHTIYSWSFNLTEYNVEAKKSFLPVILGSVSAVVVLVCTVVTCLICVKRARGRMEQNTCISESGFKEISFPRFSYADLSTATKRFSENEMLGKGGYRSVYKGILPTDKSFVAIKVMSAQGYHQFIAELSVIGCLKHRNIVGLKGWYYERDKLILVYDYMPNGSLDQLFSSEKLLPWCQRYEIVKGVAEGLAFLHGGWEQRIVHRDIKAANVLLDSKFVARLGDFGLSKLMENNRTQQTMTRAGTTSYIAPELAYLGKASEKSDIYSFGILLLEIACGKSSVGIECGFLFDWVWEAELHGQLLRVADPRLDLAFDTHEMTLILLLGLLCSHPDSEARPSMRRCCQILNFESGLPDLPTSKPTMFFGNSQPNSATNSSSFSQSTTTTSTGHSSGVSSSTNPDT